MELAKNNHPSEKQIIVMARFIVFRFVL